MDKKKAFDSSTQWISDEQRIHETSDYGRNQRAVNDALAEQQRRVKLVNEYSKDVDKATVAAKSTSEKDRISEEYAELKEVAQHRENCLKDIAQIASLEDIFNTLSIEFANRASSLVVDACSEAAAVSSPSSASAIGGASGGTHDSSDGIARAAQSCILAVRNNWNWISKLVKCSDVHLKHVSDYHQFFHEAKEYGQWMPAELNKHVRSLEKMKPEEDDEAALLKSLKEILAVFLHWQNKINILFDKSRKIVPVHQRTKPLDHYVPVTSLCDYKTNEITIQEGEELTLLDNSKPQIWLVRNMHSRESRVPSVICVIPGPDTEAVNVAMRLRLHLLKTWTVCVRNIGHVVILYFGLVLKDWDEDSRKKLQSMTDDDKMRTLQVLQWILDIFSKYWKDDGHFRDLFLRIENTRSVVRGNGNPGDYDSSFSREYITRVKIMEELLTHFRNYLKQWETYKLLAEASRQSDYMLLMQNWEELNFFSTEEVLRKVTLDMEMSSEQTDTTDNVQEVTENTISEQIIEKVETTLVTCEQEDVTVLQEETVTLQEETTTQEEETRTSFQTVEQHAEAEQYLHAEQEERKKFVITEGGRGSELDSGSSMDDITHLSPRLPGDGIEYGGEDTGVTDLSKSKLPVKSSEEYLDQSLIQRMSSTEKQSRLHQMKKIFQQKHTVNQTETNHTEYPVEGKTLPKSPWSPQSPKKTSKIPRFSSSETINTSEEKISKRGASKIPTPMFRSKSVSMDHLNTGPEETARISMFSGVSTSDRSVSNSHHQSVETLSLSHSHGRDAHNSPMTYRKKDGTSVLIYTEETESLIGVPIMAEEIIKPEMCTVGTQYEASSEDQTRIVSAGSGNGSSAIAGGGHLLFGHQESTKETVLITSEKHTKSDTNTSITTEKETGKSQSGATKGVEERFGFKGMISSTETSAGIDTTDLEISGKKTEDTSLRYRGKRKGKGKINRIQVEQSDKLRGNQDGSSEEEMFYLAQEAKGLHTEAKSESGMYGSGLLWRKSDIKRDTAMGMVRRITETTSTQTEQLELLQGAIAAIMADPDIDDSSKGRSALCLRICKACLPLQMLMLLLLGLACLFPMSEEEYSCTLSNNFENSLAMMLRHRDGPPPV